MPDSLWVLLANFGIGGVVLGWFMWKSEPRLRSIEAAIDRMARAILLLVISLPNVLPVVKGQAGDIVKEIDEAARARKEALP